MKEGINKDLIFKYLSGGATVLEKELIGKWASGPEGKELFFIWLQEWENRNLQFLADVDQAIGRHEKRMAGDRTADFAGEEDCAGQQATVRTAPGTFRRFPFRFPAAGRSSRLVPYKRSRTATGLVAAAMLFLLAGGGWLFREQLCYRRYQTGYGEVKRFQLRDRSKVVLNANSVLRVPRPWFAGDRRECYLAGEAAFSVAHTDDHRKFTVRTGNGVSVEVLGTEFNVYNRRNDTRVVLNKGRVRLHYRDGGTQKQLLMQPGDVVSRDEQGRTSLNKTQDPEHFSSWKNHRFVFENKSLEAVCPLFEDIFGVKVLIPDSLLKRQTITGSFTALNAEELLELLAEGAGISYRLSDDGRVVTLSY